MDSAGLRRFIAESARAHALRFEHPLAPAYAEAAGKRVLVAFVAVALVLFVVLRAALAASPLRGTPAAGLVFVLALAAAFVLAHRYYVRLPWAQIGLCRMAQWTPRARLYVAQVVPLAAICFAIVFRDHLRALLAMHGVAGFLVFAVATGIAWGCVQEFLYRGWLQTELARRFGPLAGLLAANVAFTFGPLHWDHLAATGGPRWGTIAAIFGVGLIFGWIYRRSGNAWIPAILHGLWPPNMA